MIDRHIVFFYILLFLILQFSTFNYNIDREEFRDYNAYTLTLEGKLPYFDYVWLYGPLGPFIYAFLFNVFGSELLVLRITAIIIGCIGIILAYRLSKFIMPKRLSALSGFLAIASFYLLPSHTYNHHFGILVNMAAAIFIFRFINSSRLYNLFIAGILSSVSLLIHPLTFGLEILLSVLIWLALFCFINKFHVIQFFKHAFVFLVGAFVLAFPIYLVILSKIPFVRVFPSFWQYTRYPLTLLKFWINLPEVHSISDVIDKAGIIRLNLLQGLIDPAMFYLLLFITPLSAIILVFKWLKRHENYQLILQISFLVVLICSILPYFVYSSYLIPVVFIFGKFYIQYSVILLIFLLYWLFKHLFSLNDTRILKTSVKLLGIFFIITIFFFYHGVRLINRLNKTWYTFNTTPIKGIYLSDREVSLYIDISECIKNNSNPNDKLFVTWYEPAYYALSNRVSIFPDYMYSGSIPFDKLVDSSYLPKHTDSPMKMEDVIIERIKSESPKFIVYRPFIPRFAADSNNYIGPKVEKYIFDNYSVSKIFYFEDTHPITVYIRREPISSF